MSENLVQQLHRAAVTQQKPELLEAVNGERTTHYSELPEAKPDSPLFREWNTYRREVGRLLRGGYEGLHVLIKDERIVGIWPSHDEALSAGYQQFLGQSFLVHQIQERERGWRDVTERPCRILPSPYCRAS